MKINNLDQEDFWEFLSSNQVLDEDFICKHFESLKWDNICEFQKLSERLMYVMQKFIDLYWVFYKQKVSEEFIEKFAKSDRDWKIVFNNQNYSDQFLMKHIDKITDWEDFMPRKKRKIPLQFIDWAVKNNKKVNWRYLVQFKKLNNETIKKYKEKISKEGFSTEEFSERELKNLIKCGVELTNIYNQKGLSESFVREHIDEIDWNDFSRFNNFSIDFMREFEDKIHFSRFSMRNDIPFEVFEEFIDKIEWDEISTYYNKIDKKFVERFGDKLNSKLVAGHNLHQVDETYLNDIYWEIDDDDKTHLFQYQHLSEDFIIDHVKSKKDWKRFVSISKDLSEEFIEKYKDKISWDAICIHQNLSMNFMRKHWKYLNWEEVCIFQKLSKKFMKEFEAQLVWSEVILNQTLSKEMIDKLVKEFSD